MRRDHVVRKLARHMFAYIVRGRSRPLCCNKPGDEARIAGPILTQDHHGLADTRTLFQHRFNLSWLDAMTAQLDLVIGAADVIKIAVGQAADEIAGAIEAQ